MTGRVGSAAFHSWFPFPRFSARTILSADVRTDQVLITTQNHGFAVVGDNNGVPGAPALEVTHLNLNDGTIEGIRHREP